MSTKKITEMRALSLEAMRKELAKSHEELLNLRFRLATRQLVNHREIPNAKKRIARLNTLIKEKELGIR
ncbi:MAG: 50S ribosomal protein L29 [Chloroflexota bacterium]